jgi:riboflavin-specific deaminase-like protein
MRQLLPRAADEAVPYDVYRPDDPHRPLVRMNMVASVDGHTVDPGGRSGGLGGPGDLEVFRALRALADGILAGAGTVRTEGYGAHRVHHSVADARRADGRHAPAAMVVVSKSLDLDLRARIFREAVTPTIVLSCAAAPPDRRRALEGVATVVTAGDATVDLAEAVDRLREDHGIRHLLVEGGPTINAGFLEAGLVDELCVTIAAQLVGGDSPGIAGGSTTATDLELVSLLTDDRDLFARYLLAR